MTDEKTTLVLDPADLGGLTVQEITCTDCIDGYCPARTPSDCAGTAFILCGAKKASQPVLEAYQQRTGSVLHIEKPC